MTYLLNHLKPVLKMKIVLKYTRIDCINYSVHREMNAQFMKAK